MSTTLAALITSCRTLAADGPLDNFMRAENLNDAEFGFPIDGLNRSFVVKNFPIVPGGVQKVVVDNATTTAFVVIEAIGEVDVAVAPLTSIFVSYYFYLFSDFVWTEFVTSALQICNFSSAVPITDVPQIGEAFLPAVKLYAGAFFARRVAAQTGLWYNQRLQERVEDRDNISSKWLRVAESNEKQALEMLNAAYRGSASDQGPSFRVGGFQPQPYTPRR